MFIFVMKVFFLNETQKFNIEVYNNPVFTTKTVIRIHPY